MLAGRGRMILGAATLQLIMTYTIAIQPDRVRHKNGELQSFSTRWAELATEMGINVRMVDAFAMDLFDHLADCHGFMWRFDYSPMPRLFAKRLLLAIEHGLGIPVFPSCNTVWHFEDKVSQHYLLQSAGVPSPRTWVFWQREPALEFCRQVSYPLVMKLSYGYQSFNVHLLRSAEEAEYWIEQMFGPGVTSIIPPGRSGFRRALRRARAAVRQLSGDPLHLGLDECELQHGYFYVQEFLPGNDFDTRVTIIGDRAFAFRRFNRPNDFRASGSGRIDWDPSQVDLESVRLAYRVALKLQTQSLGVDVLRKGKERVLNEISYTYASWAVRECPGHWVLRGESASGELNWVEGKMSPEDAIFQDFVAQVKQPR
jgi:hypothetical protein